MLIHYRVSPYSENLLDFYGFVSGQWCLNTFTLIITFVFIFKTNRVISLPCNVCSVYYFIALQLLMRID